MPSKRKRIGYLPSQEIQEIITTIANKRKLSQSKVVGILVQEALIARGEFGQLNKNNFNRENRYTKENNMDNESFKYNELDELISDKGITYNTKKYHGNSDISFSGFGEGYSEELFEQFKQFMLFQKMIKKQS